MKNQIATKDMLFGAGVQSASLPLPELGDGVEVLVRGFSIGDVIEVSEGSTSLSSTGEQTHSNRNDLLLTVIKALVEPALTIEDTERIMALPAGVVERIIAKSKSLSKSSQGAYDELKDMLRVNPYIRRIYSVCANRLGRLPSEIAGVSESEFVTLLAALELDEEEERTRSEAALAASSG